MLPILQIGPLALQLPGLILLAGVWAGLELAERSAPNHGVDANDLNRLVLIGLVVGLAAARLAYAARFSSVYIEDPLGLLALTPITLMPEAGLAAGGLAFLIYVQRRKMAALGTMDALVPGLSAIGVAAGLAHLASGDAFGMPSNVPWAIDLWGALRQPSQIYETLVAAGILWLVIRRGRLTRPAGEIFWLWLSLSAGARLFLETFRGDSLIVLGSLREPQLIAAAVLVFALTGLHFSERRPAPEATS
jgi:phosphatidylglycerol:prolipoprotein diacylglycerol transferase